MRRLENKVAVVTGGAGSGIGHGISLELAREGARVAIFELDMQAADSLCARIQSDGGCARAYRADISRGEEVRRAIDQVAADFGRLDVLVNNAGIGMIRAAAEATEEDYDRVHSINLRGAWLCAKYAIPHMQRQGGGSIVNIASVHARATMPLYALYATMKAGIVGLTRGLAVQYGPDGIRANAVLPGLVDGKQTREVIGQFVPDVDRFIADFVRRHQAVPRPISPADVGQVVAFLAGDGARAITGAEIPVDAGLLALLLSRD